MKKALIFGLVSICFHFRGNAQCNSRITVLRYSEGTSAQHDGVIRIELQTNAYSKIQLIKSADKKNEEVVKVISSSRAQVIEFDHLDESHFYRVTAEFEGEKRPICRRRTTDYLELLKSK